MKPLALRVNNDQFTLNISRVFNIESVLETKETILDEDFVTNGAVIELPTPVNGIFDIVDRIKLPPCPAYMDENIVILDNLALRINNLLRVIELVKTGEKDFTILQKSVFNLQKIVLQRLGGKTGVISKDILGKRLAHTGRGVLLPSPEKDVETVLLPKKIIGKLHLKEGDAIIVGRDPTIWHGSIEVLRVGKGHTHNTIHVHPFVFKQLAADCDGDTVWVMKIPDHLQTEMQKEVLGFYKTSSTHVSKCASGGGTITYLNPILDDTETGCWHSTGFSVGPIDILSQEDDCGSALQRFRDSTNKDIREEAYNIADGLNLDDYLDYLLTVNETMLVQKIYLGPVGAAAQKLKLVAGNNLELRKSANYISERVQQMLFDVKTTVTGDRKELGMFFEILDIINMSNSWSSINRMIYHEKAIDRLNKLGLDKDEVTPIIRLLYTAYPFYAGIVQVLGVAGKVSAEDIELVSTQSLKLTRKYSSLSREIHDIAHTLNLSIDDISIAIARVKKTSTLGNMLDDPLYDIINPFSNDRFKAAIMCLKAKIESPEDSPGVFRHLTEVIFYKSLEAEDAERDDTSGEISPVRWISKSALRRGGAKLPDLQDDCDLDEYKEQGGRAPVPARNAQD